MTIRTIKTYTKKGRPFIMRYIALKTVESDFCGPQAGELLFRLAQVM